MTQKYIQKKLKAFIQAVESEDDFNLSNLSNLQLNLLKCYSQGLTASEAAKKLNRREDSISRLNQQLIALKIIFPKRENQKRIFQLNPKVRDLISKNIMRNTMHVEDRVFNSSRLASFWEIHRFIAIFCNVKSSFDLWQRLVSTGRFLCSKRYFPGNSKSIEFFVFKWRGWGIHVKKNVVEVSLLDRRLLSPLERPDEVLLYLTLRVKQDMEYWRKLVCAATAMPCGLSFQNLRGVPHVALVGDGLAREIAEGGFSGDLGHGIRMDSTPEKGTVEGAASNPTLNDFHDVDVLANKGYDVRSLKRTISKVHHWDPMISLLPDMFQCVQDLKADMAAGVTREHRDNQVMFMLIQNQKRLDELEKRINEGDK